MKERYCAYCTSPIPKTETVCPHCKKELLAAPLNPIDLTPGTVLKGRYVIGVCLGRGGFGAAYIARDTKRDVPVAVKEYYPSFACDGRTPDGTLIVKPGKNSEEKFKTFLKHFQKETDILNRLKGVSGVRQLVDDFDILGTSYQVLEYLDGMNLSEVIQRQGRPFSLIDASVHMQHTLDILSRVHEKGVLHRDISPDNIFLCTDGSLRVIDFGSAYIIGTQPEDSFAKAPYTPPEQIQGAAQAPYTDVYAAGITLFYLLTGRKPNVQIGASAEKLPEAFSTVKDVYMNAVAQNPALRYQTAADMRDALAAVSGVSVVPAAVTPQPSQKKKRKVLLPVLLVLLIAVVAMIFMSISQGDTAPSSAIYTAAPIATAEPTAPVNETSSVTETPNDSGSSFEQGLTWSWNDASTSAPQ